MNYAGKSLVWLIGASCREIAAPEGFPPEPVSQHTRCGPTPDSEPKQPDWGLLGARAARSRTAAVGSSDELSSAEASQGSGIAQSCLPRSSWQQRCVRMRGFPGALTRILAFRYD